MRIAALILAIVALVVAAAEVVGRSRMTRRETSSLDAVEASVPGRIIRVDGRRVHVVERGAGPPLLLVHGTGGTTLDWEATVLDRFAARHRVIAVDLLGMGFSERDEAAYYGFGLWTEQLAGTLSALGVDRADVVGHSLGGAVSLVFAAQHPELVSRLVSVASGPWLPPFMLLLMLPGSGEMWMGGSEYWPVRPDAKGPYVERMQRVYAIEGTRRALLRLIRAQMLDASTYASAVSHISCPALFVHGADDDIIPYRAAASLASLVPGSRIVAIPAAGHFVMNDQPERFADEVERFLAEDVGPAVPAVSELQREGSRVP